MQRVVLAVGRGLALAHGQRQFHSLSQVQAQAAAIGIAPALQAWVHASFVSRADFEAYFAMRERPGSYEQMRAAMSMPAMRARSDEFGVDDVVDMLWRWLDGIGDLGVGASRPSTSADRHRGQFTRMAAP